MPQDGTNPQVGKAPLMMSQEMEGEQLDELKVAPKIPCNFGIGRSEGSSS